MKTLTTLFSLAICFTSSASMAAVGRIDASVATNRANTLNLTIVGPAATTISAQLLNNGVTPRMDGFSGAQVQMGQGIRCIQQGTTPVYCYIAVVGASVQ